MPLEYTLTNNAPAPLPGIVSSEAEQCAGGRGGPAASCSVVQALETLAVPSLLPITDGHPIHVPAGDL